jgi:hypothetical protein
LKLEGGDGGMSVAEKVKCPWCSEEAVPQIKVSRNNYGTIKERRCPKCKSVIAAYLDEKRTILDKVRSFQD